MKIVCDNKIPFLRGVLEPFAEVVYLPGKETTPEVVKDADALIEDAVRRLGDKVSVLHMKDYVPLRPQDTRAQSIACGQGIMDYKRLLTFAKRRNLPMTLEDTVPENAQGAREYLEKIAQSL